MSYNNYLDADAAWNCVSEFKSPTCVIVKHTNPCGVASRQDILEAYRLAVKADPVSAFGGIVAFNTTVDEVRNNINESLFGWYVDLHLFVSHNQMSRILRRRFENLGVQQMVRLECFMR